jgi:hypothetical protein
MHPLLSEGTFFDYTISAGIIRGWNYTIENASIVMHDGSVFYERNVISTIFLRIEFSTSTLFLIEYNASTVVGYNIEYSVEATFNSDTGQISILNGSLAGFSGSTSLFSNDNWRDRKSTISKLDTWNVTAEFVQEDALTEINGGYQRFSEYKCTTYDPVDGEIIHYRQYDSDTEVLIGSNGAISDPFILGLANISYCVGTMILADTNYDFGPYENLILDSLPTIMAISAVGIFVILYISFYRIQRKTHRRSKDFKQVKQKQSKRNRQITD